VPLRAGPGGCRTWSRYGTRPGRVHQLPRPAQADGVLRTAARPRAPAAHRLGDRTGSSALSAPATTARATATAEGRSGVATPTTQMTSSAVCALMTLAFMLDAARLAAAAKAAGSGRGSPSSLAARTVTSYLLGGLLMPGTVRPPAWPLRFPRIYPAYPGCTRATVGPALGPVEPPFELMGDIRQPSTTGLSPSPPRRGKEQSHCGGCAPTAQASRRPRVLLQSAYVAPLLVGSNKHCRSTCGQVTITG
jgi:hypothetical protein